MTDTCDSVAGFRDVTPGTLSCEEYLETGSEYAHSVVFAGASMTR